MRPITTITIARGRKYFVGEWATREGKPTTNMNAALGDAAWMTGMERNSDIVIMSCYAPLFVNVNPGGMQWQLGSDWLRYLEQLWLALLLRAENVQHISGRQRGFHHLGKYSDANLATPDAKGQTGRACPRRSRFQDRFQRFFTSPPEIDKKGKIYLKVVNTAATPQAVQINLIGTANIAPEGTVVGLEFAKPDRYEFDHRADEDRTGDLQRQPVWETRLRGRLRPIRSTYCKLMLVNDRAYLDGQNSHVSANCGLR